LVSNQIVERKILRSSDRFGCDAAGIGFVHGKEVEVVFDLSTDRLLDERAAAQILNCSVALMRKWRRIGEGPVHHKVGPRIVRYAAADLQAFIAGCRKEVK
jgi:hypothetical protein